MCVCPIHPNSIRQPEKLNIMHPVPVISVVIPSYNSMHTIRRCLDSVMNQSITVPYEIIVVDSSEDKTPEILETYAPRVRYYHLSRKTIPAIARNIGIDHAAGEYIAFTDSDCIVDENWLQQITKSHGSGYDVVCGSIINARPANLISIAEYFLEFRELSEYLPEKIIHFFPAGNFSIKAEVIKEAGGFPDIRASEDMFLGHHLAAKGISIFFNPRIKIRHINRNRLKDLLKNQITLGFSAACARKVLPLPGSFLVKHHSYAVLIPVIRFFRTLQIIGRNRFPFNLYQFLNFMISLPIYLIGIAAFGIGFSRGVRNKG